MKKIRLLFLPPVDADNTNAQSLNTREIVLRLDRSRFEITLFCWHAPDPRLLNLAHVRVLTLPSRRKTLRLLREMCSGYDIIAYMDYSPASFIFVHLPSPLRGGAKAVLHAEGPARLTDAPRLLQFLYQGVVANCDVYTAITECVARDIARTLHRKATYMLPVGVDCGAFAPAFQESPAKPTVLFVGTLIETKSPLLVLEAARRFPEAKFRLIGAGRAGYGEVVARQVAEWQLNNVTLEGGRSQSEVAQAMRESDVFLLPSRSEGLPKVTLEAAASGLPCIVFRDYETPSVVDNVTGFHVNTREQMMEKLALLVSDPVLRKRMGLAARHHANKFDWNEIGRRWEKAYLEIAAAELSGS
jgi:glycosyltransferase involved in cell wall biosynthesis